MKKYWLVKIHGIGRRFRFDSEKSMKKSVETFKDAGFWVAVTEMQRKNR
jgi:hypothetical protein